MQIARVYSTAYSRITNRFCFICCAALFFAALISAAQQIKQKRFVIRE
ncbi:hypothetical protein FZ680_22480 [Salmonella enterica subsp. enterica serovar Bovismorbificans]|nr:hypothetical protein [Salmonella enterica subsp. enterica serovar Bovismorbificans]